MSYLDNGVIRLGVSLDLGGSITYLADSKKRVNVVNNHDWGRQIQMSFYSGPKPYAPDGKQPAEQWKGLGWNPIQSGDFYGNRARVLEHRNDEKALYIKCTPMHWPLNDEPGQCTFESWIELKGYTVHVRSRINNNRADKTQYPARGQELPAVYTNGFLHRLMTYAGDQPFTGGELTRIKKVWGLPGQSKPQGNPWAVWHATENWAALVGDDQWGLGIWTPGTHVYNGGFFGQPGKGGSEDPPTGYIGPTQREILDHNIQYEYCYVLILGELETIRQYVYDHAARPQPPAYRFESDRQHWRYRNCRDTGWPIRGELHVLLDGNDSQLIGPPGLWRAVDAPTLRLRAAFGGVEDRVTVLWRNFDDRSFSAAKSLTFRVRPDGEYHTYEVDLRDSPTYKGMIAGLRLDPVPRGESGSHVRVESLALR